MENESLGNARFKGSTRRAIAAWWRASGATQEVAAEHAGVHVQTLAKWEQKDDAEYWAEHTKACRHLKRHAWDEAWLVVRSLIRSQDPNVALRAAHEIITSVDRDLPQRHEHSGADGGAMPIVIYRPAPKPIEDEDGT